MAKDLSEIRENFILQKEELYSVLLTPLSEKKFSIEYSLLIESIVKNTISEFPPGFTVVSAGGLSRLELSPFSDIDIVFIIRDNTSLPQIKEIITRLWDIGLEISHTIRTFDDISSFYETDLHAFTQFLEFRFLTGDKELFSEWKEILSGFLTDDIRKELLTRFIEDINLRYRKYGESSKGLEPNLKYSAGCLRDLHCIDWIYSLQSGLSFDKSNRTYKTLNFLDYLETIETISTSEINRVKSSYVKIIDVRNILHHLSLNKNDRLEFHFQEKIAGYFGYDEKSWQEFMREFYLSTNIIHRFTTTIIKRLSEQFSNNLPDTLIVKLDEIFSIKGNVISAENKDLNKSDLMRAFYYRGLYDARFDENLRNLIIESSEVGSTFNSNEFKTSFYFRQILRLEKNVFKTLKVMNDLGLLSDFIPEFKDLVGYFQPGVYHCYTADEHTLIAIKSLEELRNNDSRLGYIYSDLLEKDLLYLAIIFHDIAKPISLAGHEIIGAEVACTIMQRMGFVDKEIQLIQFLVKNHLVMEQVAFRRDLNDAQTLNNFTSLFQNIKSLDMLLLLTYADLNAVSPIVWTQWKSDQLYELYRKSRAMLLDELTGEELLYKKTLRVIKGSGQNNKYTEHIESIDDVGYVYQFSEEEIEKHVHEIERGSKLAVFFKEDNGYTNVTIISRDSYSILTKFCGVLSINDCNIHDARIFTRKDGIIIDSFNVTNYSTNTVIDPNIYPKIESDLKQCLSGELQINVEFKKFQSKWRRLENRLFKRNEKIKIRFEDHDRFTIIDVASPDRLGLLYTITKKMTELGLTVFFAKISTKADDVIDAFYTLDRSGKKISPNDYEMIRVSLTDIIKELI